MIDLTITLISMVLMIYKTIQKINKDYVKPAAISLLGWLLTSLKGIWLHFMVFKNYVKY